MLEFPHAVAVRGVVRVISLALLGATLALTPGSFGVPAFSDATGWINSPPLDPRELQGKVVLVDFWEYTCVNCLRTLPYLKTWYERYRDDGLVIVGVHTPEFEFSGEPRNVEAATKRLGITWPVVLDTGDAIWRRYGNDSWPEEYLFDQDGKLVENFSGEGRYQETEARIQALLKARNSRLTVPPVMALLPQDNYTKPGAVCYLQTPEILLERSKIANAPASAGRGAATFTDTGAPHKDGGIYLQGEWRTAGEAVVGSGTPAYLALHYHAIQVVGVFAPATGSSVRVDVTQDDAPISKADAGPDLQYDAQGMSYVTVDSSRAYELVMNAKMAFHELRLTPQAPGLAVYSFAFESCEVPSGTK